MKEKFTVVGVVLALVLGVFGLFNGDKVYPTTKVTEVSTGAVAGPDHMIGTEYFYDGIASGSKLGCFATSTAASGAAAATLTARQMDDYNCFRTLINTQSNQVLTLPASTTLITLLPAVGMTRSWYFINATTTAAATLTIAAGTGINLIGVTANDDVIDGTERSKLECWKVLDAALTYTEIDCAVTEWVNAD